MCVGVCARARTYVGPPLLDGMTHGVMSISSVQQFPGAMCMGIPHAVASICVYPYVHDLWCIPHVCPSPCPTHQLVQWDVENAACLRDVSSAHPKNACILQVKVCTHFTPHTHLQSLLSLPLPLPSPSPSPSPSPFPSPSSSPSPPLPLPLSTLTCTTLHSSVTSQVPFTV